MNRGPQLALMPQTIAYNRERALERRRLPLPDGRTWLQIVCLACVTHVARLDDVLAGIDNAPAREARELAYRRLCDLSCAPPHEVARALGINDHRAVDERDRTGDR